MSESVVKRIIKAPHIYWGFANFCYGMAAQTTMAMIGAGILIVGSTINVLWGIFRPVDGNRPPAKNPLIRRMDIACSNPAFYMIFAGVTLGGVYATNYGYRAVQAYNRSSEVVVEPQQELAKMNQELAKTSQELAKTNKEVVRYNGLMAFGTTSMMTGNFLMASTLFAMARRKREGR